MRRSPRPQAIDEVATKLIETARSYGDTVVVLSEYGITKVSRPVDINRELRRSGLLHVYTQDGMEYLDPWTSRAFAVADHQIAHVYVRDPADVAQVRELLAALPGVATLLDADTKGEAGLDHERCRRARRARRARQLVHLLLLARRGTRAGLRAAGGDPPQAGL